MVFAIWPKRISEMCVVRVSFLFFFLQIKYLFDRALRVYTSNNPTIKFLNVVSQRFENTESTVLYLIASQ